MTRARLPVLLFVIGALVAALLVDRSWVADPAPQSDPATSLSRSTPVVSPVDALGSTWYCAAGSAGDIGDVPPPVEDTTPDEGPASPDEAATAEDESSEGGSADDEAEEPTADAPTETGPLEVGPIVAEQTVVIANRSEVDQVATLTIHTGTVINVPAPEPEPAEEGEGTAASSTTTTVATTTSTTEDEPEPAGPLVVTVDVPAQSVETVALAEHVAAPAAAVLVEVPGGGVAVSHRVEGEHGADAGPCASSSSSEWHFAWGDTSRDARSFIALFNPFPGDAVVDMSFATSDGLREPQALQGLVVPGGSVVVTDVGAEVRRRDQVATTVRARTGRIVAERLQSFDGSAGTDEDRGRVGMTLDLGVAAPQEAWINAYGRVGPNFDQRVVVYNPTEGPAEVDVALALGPDAVGGIAPFELTVAPRSSVAVDLGSEPRVQAQVGEDDTAFVLRVTSLNGVPVVSEVVSQAEGVSASTGQAGTSGSLVLVDPASTASAARLRLVNLAPESPVEVTVDVVRDGRATRIELDAAAIDPAGWLSVDLTRAGTAPALVIITSSGPVAAELANVWIGSGDFGTQPPIPTLQGLVPVPTFAD